MNGFLTLVFAVLAASANALSSVLQRKGALSEPDEESRGLKVVLDQLHHKAWFGGFAMLIAGFLLQAAALSVGSLAVVQPVLAAELPLTLLIASRVFHRGLGRREWLAVLAMAAGLAALLGAASPTQGRSDASGLAWALGSGAVVLVLAITAGTGWSVHGQMRAGFLGATSGGLFGLTAAFMATATQRAQNGPGALFSAWQLYAMALAGMGALVVLQQAYAAGMLTVAQPGVTIADPIVAVGLGVGIFGEQVRLGWLLPLEIVAVLAIGFGAVELSRSPLTTGADDSPPGGDDGGGGASAAEPSGDGGRARRRRPGGREADRNGRPVG